MPEKRKPGRPAKDASKVKGDYLEVRLEPAEKNAFRKAADVTGLALSAWVRSRLRRAAIKDLEEVGRTPEFLQ